MARTGGMRGLGSDEAVWIKLIHLSTQRSTLWIFEEKRFFYFFFLLLHFVILTGPGVDQKSALRSLQWTIYSGCPNAVTPSWPEVRSNRRDRTFFHPFPPLYIDRNKQFTI